MNDRTEIKKLIKTEDNLYSALLLLEDDSVSKEEVTNLLANTSKKINNFVTRSKTGVWLLKHVGMNQTSAASILTNFDVTGKECAAQFISYAGLDDNSKPHNKDAQQTIYSFIDDIWKYKLDKSLYYKLIDTKICAGNSSAKAKRYAAKVFTAHIFEQMYREAHGKTPNTDAEKVPPEIEYIM